MQLVKICFLKLSLEIEERPSEPIIVFAADKTEPGAWNLPLYRVFLSNSLFI